MWLHCRHPMRCQLHHPLQATGKQQPLALLHYTWLVARLHATLRNRSLNTRAHAAHKLCAALHSLQHSIKSLHPPNSNSSRLTPPGRGSQCPPPEVTTAAATTLDMTSTASPVLQDSSSALTPPGRGSQCSPPSGLAGQRRRWTCGSSNSNMLQQLTATVNSARQVAVLV